MGETLALAEAAGIDAKRLPAALAGGMADSTVLRRIYPRQQARWIICRRAAMPASSTRISRT